MVTAEAETTAADPVATTQTALLEQGPAPTLTDNDLVAATFEVLRVELTSTAGELTSRKVKTVTVNADGSLAMGADESGLSAGATAASQEEMLVADVAAEPVADTAPHPAASAATLSPEGRGEEASVMSDESSAEASATSLAYAPASGDSATVGGKGVNVRSLPQKGGSEVLFALEGGAEVTIVEMRKGWAKVVDARGRSGWVYGEYLRRG